MDILKDKKIINDMIENVGNDEVYKILKDIVSIKRDKLREEFEELVIKLKRK